MADRVELRLAGLDGVLGMLQQLPPEIVSKRGGPVRAALRRGALVIRNEAKARVPVDSGALKDAIVVTRGKPPADGNGERYLVRVGKPFKRKYVNNARNRQMSRASQTSAKEYDVEEPPAIYGRFLEYGTSKMSPKPWLRPAFYAKAGEAIRTVEAELLKSIDRIVRRLGKQGGLG